MSADERREFTDALTYTVAGAVQTLDPDLILLGGGVAAMEGFPFADFTRGLYEHTLKPLPAGALEVRLAPRSGEAGVIGAALFADARSAEGSAAL
jgi:allose kinase